MARRVPVPGKVKPTPYEIRRRTAGAGASWRPPARGEQREPDLPGVRVCPRCNAIQERRRWFLDQAKLRAYLYGGGAAFVLCPGCVKVERRMYDGDVVLRGPILLRNKRQALHMIRGLEARARHENPISRIGALHDRGDEIGVLTTDTWLARRIGREFQRAFGGGSTYRWDRGRKAVRVRWERPEA